MRKFVWLAVTGVLAIGIAGGLLGRFKNQSVGDTKVSLDPGTPAFVEIPKRESSPEPLAAALARDRQLLDAVRDTVIAFPDGSTIPVRLRNAPRPGVPIASTAERLIDFYDELANRARNGDAAAAHALYRQLERCNRAFANEEALNEAVNLLHREGTVMLPDGKSKSKLPPGTSLAEFEEMQLRRPFKYCQGLDEEKKREAAKWFKIAVDAGHYWALKDWAMSLRGTEREIEAWQYLWSRGHATVLPALRIQYSRGVGDSPPDYVRAYAYKFVEVSLLKAAYEGSPSPLRTNKLIAVENSLKDAGSYLTPQETDEAIELAKELLDKNTNCCVGTWW